MSAAQVKGAKPEGSSRASENETTDELQAQLAVLREELSKVKAQLASSGGRSLEAARKVTASGIDQLYARGEAAFDDLKGGAKDAQAQLATTLRERPVTSLAIAAGLGYLLALIARR